MLASTSNLLPLKQAVARLHDVSTIFSKSSDIEMGPFGKTHMVFIIFSESALFAY